MSFLGVRHTGLLTEMCSDLPADTPPRTSQAPGRTRFDQGKHP